jgi:hypothetical protein
MLGLHQFPKGVYANLKYLLRLNGTNTSKLGPRAQRETLYKLLQAHSPAAIIRVVWASLLLFPRPIWRLARHLQMVPEGTSQRRCY